VSESLQSGVYSILDTEWGFSRAVSAAYHHNSSRL
jgi:hypothetical protein